MYTPEHFAITDPAVLHALVQRHPLGTLVTHGQNGLDAEHLPFHFQPPSAGASGVTDAATCGVLSAHVARANPLWRRAHGQPVLVVFHGPQAYVSPSWYPSKHEHHRQVPTWNYEVVHAHGVLQVLDDERFLRGLLARLTRTHEAAEPHPWRMGDAPADYIAERMRDIVGIEVHLSALTGKSKLSQNKELRDRAGAAEALAERGQLSLAQRMRATLPPDSGAA